MLSATLYITACTMRNRTRRWLRRLREPRYLFGLIAVLAYFYFTVFVRLRTTRGNAARQRSAAALAAFPALSGAAPVLASAALLVAAAASWLMPGSGRLLEFSPAEVQFLAPAPVRRRSVIVHRLIRSQVGLLLAALVPAAAISLPSGSPMMAVRTAAAIWVLLVAGRVYFSAVVLARSHVMSADPRLRRLARLPLVAVLAAVLIVGGAFAREFLRQPFVANDAGFSRLAGVVTGGLPRVVLWPFLTLVQQFFAPTWPAYGLALVTSLAVVAAAMAWLLASDEAFQDATVEAAHQQIEVRTGKAVYRARRTDWTLAPTGRPEVAFVWKSTMQMFRVVDRRVLLRVVLIVIALSFLIVTVTRTRGPAAVVGLFAVAGAVYTVLLAPQILRLDLRQDLQHLELLKTWPVRSAAIVRGEMMGPALALSALAWALIGLALFLSTAAFSRTTAEWRMAIAGGAIFMAPSLIFAQYAVHNGVALIFPAWVSLGAGRARGLDAMGQRLLTLGGTWVVLALITLPGAAVGAILWFAFYRVIGPPVVVVAAAVCAVIMALETLMMTEALGPAYERLDLMAVERPE